MENEGKQDQGRATDKKDVELMELDTKITGLKKELENIKQSDKKANMVNDQVKSWTHRVVQKVEQQFNEIIDRDGEKPIPQVFELVARVVCKQLEQIIAEEDDEERGFITAKDFLNDFATEEFLTKNIRVRPVSGVVKVEQDDTKTENAQQNKFTADIGDDDEKFNKNIVLDMEEQRKGIKRQKEEIERLRIIEEEKKAKKRGM